MQISRHCHRLSKPRSGCYDIAMSLVRLSLLLLTLQVSASHAQTPSGNAGLDCWIGNDGAPYFTHYIRCIADRDLPHPTLENPQGEALLETLHNQLHGISGAAAEKTLKTNVELVRETHAVWSIRIHSYPADWSWVEGMPERLVRSVLCPPNTACTVMIRRE